MTSYTKLHNIGSLFLHVVKNIKLWNYIPKLIMYGNLGTTKLGGLEWK